jgi:hypothetical protein
MGVPSNVSSILASVTRVITPIRAIPQPIALSPASKEYLATFVSVDSIHQGIAGVGITVTKPHFSVCVRVTQSSINK